MVRTEEWLLALPFDSPPLMMTAIDQDDEHIKPAMTATPSAAALGPAHAAAAPPPPLLRLTDSQARGIDFSHCVGRRNSAHRVHAPPSQPPPSASAFGFAAFSNPPGQAASSSAASTTTAAAAGVVGQPARTRQDDFERMLNGRGRLNNAHMHN
jgi:hypothetical protein